MSLLLQHGADLKRVGGAYRTRSGVYPNALDAAMAEGSVASPSLWLANTIGHPMGPNSICNCSGEALISRSPFPMPYSGAVLTRPPPEPSADTAGADHSIKGENQIRPDHTINPDQTVNQDGTLNPGHTISPEQAKFLCSEVGEVKLIGLLVALVGLPMM